MHDGTDSSLNSADVALHVNLSQIRFAQSRIALVEQVLSLGIGKPSRPDRGAAVTNKVLGARQNAQRVTEIVALEAPDCGFSQGPSELWRFPKPFVGSAPSFIAWNRDAGSKRPIDAGGAHFFCRHPRGAFNQLRIARAAQTNVVRKEHRAQDVVMTVHSICSVELGNAETSLKCVLLIAITHVSPGSEAVARLGVGASAAQE